jgi:hypothetical protein
MPKVAADTPSYNFNDYDVKSSTHFHQSYSTVFYQLREKIEKSDCVNSFQTILGIVLASFCVCDSVHNNDVAHVIVFQMSALRHCIRSPWVGRFAMFMVK